MFIIVFKQVFILLVLILTGFFATKGKIITEAGAKCLTDLVLIVVTPCVIVKSLIREFDSKTLYSLLVSFVITFSLHIFMILLSKLLLRSSDKGSERVLQFGSVFSNCGFMSIPLQQALLGEDGVLYGSAYVIIFNLIVWSYGIFLMSGDKKYISPKKMFANPGLIGLIVGIVIFIFSIPIPNVVYSAIDYISALYTPLPMLIIGYHISKSNIINSLKNFKCLIAVLLRLIVFPVISLFVLYICGIRGEMLVSTIISVSAPVAALTTMFSSKFSVNTSLSVDMVSLSTVLSLGTMPLIVTLSQYLGG